MVLCLCLCVSVGLCVLRDSVRRDDVAIDLSDRAGARVRKVIRIQRTAELGTRTSNAAARVVTSSTTRSLAVTMM